MPGVSRGMAGKPRRGRWSSRSRSDGLFIAGVSQAGSEEPDLFILLLPPYLVVGLEGLQKPPVYRFLPLALPASETRLIKFDERRGNNKRKKRS